jgi:CheY-like chemotaxis protein
VRNAAADGDLSLASPALERMTNETFDVVLSDMGMGAGMNGWELAAAVQHRWPTVRFRLATGWEAAIDPVAARERASRQSWPSRIVRSIWSKLWLV